MGRHKELHMTVIRGATTIACDSAEEIRAAVAELLDQIVSRNALKRDEILSIVFSSTSDIHSFASAHAPVQSRTNEAFSYPRLTFPL